jgi:hypothetical protein
MYYVLYCTTLLTCSSSLSLSLTALSSLSRPALAAVDSATRCSVQHITHWPQCRSQCQLTVTVLPKSR